MIKSYTYKKLNIYNIEYDNILDNIFNMQYV